METISFQEFLIENKDSIRKQLNTIIDPTFKGIEKPLDYKSEIDTLLELKRKPFPTQAQIITAGVSHLKDKRSLIISSEMGTGKTLMGIALSYSLLKKGRIVL
ncbi:DEAD/DEAH box helicase family protein [uncultured Helicobacter sp.]|uniref:DEAD/DEAH box helicase family protein n=1 Tax=uncultured Helicobacter sp. TaxID=175537 RepID=UPI002619637A|nr:DEAD/DEAH box helicase family protein [uncultured Helicobacter sp.]